MRVGSLPQVHRREHRSGSGCGAGWGFGYVRFDGEVWPCNFIPLSAGNVRQQSFTDIWNSSALLQGFRGPRQLKDACGACRHQDICGGCRGRAYAHHEDLKAADPLCFKSQSDGIDLR